MTKPGDPEKGKAAEAEQTEQAAKDSAEATSQASAQEAAEAAGTEPDTSGADPSAPSEAEGTAAEATGVDKAGAEAAAVSEPAEAEPAAEPEAPAKPRRSLSRKASEPETPAEAPARRRDRPRSGEQVIVRAQARYVRSSARKARLVCDGIRGKSVADARAILAFSPRNVAEAWTKLLESAVANAENNHDLVGEDLKILAVYADEGPTIKRYRPRAMGRATRIRKRTSHLTIQLTPKD